MTAVTTESASGSLVTLDGIEVPPITWSPPVRQVRRPTSHDQSGLDVIIEAVDPWIPADHDLRLRRLLGVREILEALSEHDGNSWSERWLSFEESLPETRGSWAAIVRHGRRPEAVTTPALWALCGIDLLRPSFEWIVREQFRVPRGMAWGQRRGPEEWATLTRELDVTKTWAGRVMTTVCRVMAGTGARLSELTADDLLGYYQIYASLNESPSTVADKAGLPTIWRAIRKAGWAPAASHSLPIDRRGTYMPKTAEQLVDHYGVQGPQREVFIEYLKLRRPQLTYGGFRGMTNRLLSDFWSRVTELRPGLSDFNIGRETAAAWKLALSTTTIKTRYHSILFTVRAFYADMAQWASEDSYWVPWVAPCPVRSGDLRTAGKERRLQVANRQQLTRELAPLLPRLVDRARTDLEQSRRMLAHTSSAQLGDTVDIDGVRWQVVQADPRSPRRLKRSGSRDVIPELEEDHAFWTWTSIEVLRHSGMRIEEVLELTHMALQQHRVAKTGEVIPLLHIPPSKTDCERLLVISPELMHALSEIIRRVRDDHQTIPLTRRWDEHEKVFSSELPHLFIRKTKMRYVTSAINSKFVRWLLERLVVRAGLTSGGVPVRVTPHDFRRLFATDALASGLPPHIVQILMGHRSLATTQGYMAVYPKDVIQAHRSFIDLRRAFRPSEEYREPTVDEWDQFEDHFVQRRVSLGSCSRAWGTDCAHEHACVRCSMLRPDPEQADRLRDILRNLRLRIKEAEEHRWQGEVDGLKSTLAAAELKLHQMERSASAGQVLLGMPGRAAVTPRLSAKGSAATVAVGLADRTAQAGADQ